MNIVLFVAHCSALTSNTLLYVCVHYRYLTQRVPRYLSGIVAEGNQTLPAEHDIFT